MKRIYDLFNKKDWKNIHPDFTPELQKEWEEKGFSYEECKEWIDIGLKSADSSYCAWLRNIRNQKPEWVLNQGDDQKSRKEYKKYLEDPNYIVKNPIEECWGADSKKRSTVKKLEKIIRDCEKKTKNRKNISFYQKCQTIKTECDKWTSDSPIIFADIDKKVIECEWTPYDKFSDIGETCKKRNDRHILDIFSKCEKSLNIDRCNLSNSTDYNSLLLKEYVSFLTDNYDNKEENNLVSEAERLELELKLKRLKRLYNENAHEPKGKTGKINNPSNLSGKTDFTTNSKNDQTQELPRKQSSKELETIDGQKWLNIYYPQKVKMSETVTRIDIGGRQYFGGSLVVEDFPNLRIISFDENKFIGLTLKNLPSLVDFNAENNQLSNLIIDNCPKIKLFRAKNNYLSDFNFMNLNQDELIVLDISNNKFIGLDLSHFSRFTKLNRLYLWYNQLDGSLESLKNLNNLKQLFIHLTNMDPSGLDYLPESLEKIYCETRKKEINWRGLKGDLKKDKSPYYYLDPQEWKCSPLLQVLKEELEKVNPLLSTYSVLNNMSSFNISTGDFEGNFQGLISLLQLNQSFFEKEEMKILLLTNLIKKQREKTIEAYVYFSPEKELLKNLINAELDYRKAKEQRLPSNKLHKQREKFYNELEEKLGESLMEEVELILKDCEDLVKTELKLENEIYCNKSFEDIKKKFSDNLVININKIEYVKELTNNQGIISENSVTVESFCSQNNTIIQRTRRSLSISSQTATAQEQNQIEEIIKEVYQTHQETPPKN